MLVSLSNGYILNVYWNNNAVIDFVVLYCLIFYGYGLPAKFYGDIPTTINTNVNITFYTYT